MRLKEYTIARHLWRGLGQDLDCSQGIFFARLRLEYVPIRVTMGGGSTDYERRPENDAYSYHGATHE